MTTRFPSIARFEILDVIGRGGFATVYRARQSDLGRLVALKVIHPGHHSDPDMLRRFERECQAIGSLSGHPSVMTVFEAGVTADGDRYLALELLSNGSLQDRMETPPPPGPLEVAYAGLAVAEALEAAHALAIVHRDVKPANVLVDRFGAYKLGDFGIAGIGTGGSTSLGSTATTVAYSAPEVLLGKRATVASDLYGLGATLYALLVGTPAFHAPGDESIVPMIYRVTTMPLEPLPASCGPKALRELVEQLMAKDPDERPASAALVAGRLRQIAADEAAIATRPGSAGGGRGGADPVVAPPPVEAEPPSWTAPTRSASVPSAELDRPTVPPPPAVAPVQGSPTAVPTADDASPSDPGTGRRGARKLGPVAVVGAVAIAVVVVAAVAVVLRGGGGAAGASRQVVAVGRAPRWLALGAGAVWVSNYEDGTVSRIDPGSNAVVAEVKVGATAGPLVVAGGAVWVSNYNTGSVTRIDPVTNAVAATIEVGITPDWMIAGHGSVWVANYNSRTVTRIDPSRNRVTATIPVGEGPRWLAVGDDAMWVSNYDSIMRIDPASSEVVATIDVGKAPGSLVVGPDAVWVATAAGVVRVDVATNQVARTIELDEPPGWLAEVDGEIWASMGRRVVRVDPDGGSPAQEVELGGDADWRGIGAGELWVTSARAGIVTRIGGPADDPSTSFDVDGQPAFVVVDRDAAWVASEQADTVTRIDR